jgi:DNA-binding transcriptional regulator YiaG
MTSAHGRLPSETGVLTVKVAERYLLSVDRQEVRRIRKKLGLTQSAFAALLGVHLVTVKKWETGKQGMHAPADRLIRLLAQQAATKRKRSGARKRGKRPRKEGDKA